MRGVAGFVKRHFWAMAAFWVATKVVALGVIYWLWRRRKGDGGPSEGDRVHYATLANDGSVAKVVTYAYSGGAWGSASSCYPATGHGCRPGSSAADVRVPRDVAGLHVYEVDSDEKGYLRSLHPRSAHVREPALWEMASG